MTQDTTGRVAAVDALVLDVPDPQRSAAFWRDLTGGEVEQAAEGDDWVTLTLPGGWSLAFQPAPELVPPRWPGQEHPQQLHLDLLVGDVPAYTAKAGELGATVLRESERWTTLADLDGHTFDLCVGDVAPGPLEVFGVTFDVADASATAAFWARLLGVEVTHDADGMAMIGGDRPLLFQQVEGYNPPRWPDPAYPQQGHLDLAIGAQSLDDAEAAALAAGATRLPGGGETFRVFADPAGHPFCLCRI
ncbi:VOC family protein [Isoptericola dokdonensis]|uniref:Glyoxalase-like domain protein n=1 Tax=Isoptericola dokdonensis DS-3 TaxID=1300344 RepID=A0A161IMC4_9MICO|nr:VOC family protein [Isoptericola dokdonensis]ANC31750.1 Glyoxalase-like domain protein [Isoptericola dokdonensis DS-3]